MNYLSPLRYPGGKRKLENQIINLIQINNYENGIYVEPFAGGAAVALKLLFDGHVKSIHINDLDYSIYCFWKSVTEYNSELIELIYNTPVNTSEWIKQKEIQGKFNDSTILELGFSTFYLNRTNVSGIIKGGIIGGLEQKGKYKIDARFNKINLVERIKAIGNYAASIEVTNLCVRELIIEKLLHTSEKKFIYFDPPYYEKGPELYRNHLVNEDHLEIAEMIKGIKNHYWVVTYDNVPEINEMYSSVRSKSYSLNYSAGRVSKGKEVMFFSDNLKLEYADDDIKVVI